MRTIDANGQRLNAALFVQFFNEARKLAPPRFLVLSVHPARLRELEFAAQVPEVIQLGDQPGPLGKPTKKVNCVKPPVGLGDGVVIKPDENADSSKLQVLLHGVPELELIHLADTASPETL